MTEEFNESMINDIKEGDKVTAKVQQVEDKQVVVHIDGAKYNGIIPISQLSTHHIENPSEIISEGDEIEAYVTKIEIDEEMNQALTFYQNVNLKPKNHMNIYKKSLIMTK